MAKKKVSLLKPIEKTLIERYQEIQEIGTEVEIPFGVYRVFGGPMKVISTVGEHISLGEDYVSVGHARGAVSWFATQLGGKITWDS